MNSALRHIRWNALGKLVCSINWAIGIRCMMASFKMRSNFFPINESLGFHVEKLKFVEITKIQILNWLASHDFFTVVPSRHHSCAWNLDSFKRLNYANSIWSICRWEGASEAPHGPSQSVAVAVSRSTTAWGVNWAWTHERHPTSDRRRCGAAAEGRRAGVRREQGAVDVASWALEADPRVLIFCQQRK